MTVQAPIAQAERAAAAGISFLRRPGRGAADPIVLLHGIGSNARSFAALTSAMPSSLDVIAWNAPGYGASQPLALASPTPRDYAAALATLLDALELQRVVLCGHSLGALFAASFAARYPARVAALALLSPALGYRVAPGSPLPDAVQGRIDEIESLGPQTFAKKRAARLIYAPERKPQVLTAVEQAMAAVHPQGYVHAVRALGAGDLLADATMVTAPTSVGVGAEDVVTPPANARTAFAALPRGVAFYEIADIGHALPQESPDAVAGILEALMEHVDA